MSTSFRAFRWMRSALALPVILATGVAVMNAQAPATQNSGEAAGSSFNLQIPAHLETPAFSSSNNFSGSVDETPSSPDQALAANGSEHFNFLNGQYGRRSYGKPRYRGGNTNEDGSEKYTFFAGGGFSQPIGNTYHYLTPSWALQVGGGRNFNKRFGLMAQFDYDNFGFNGRTLALQQALYNQIDAYYNATPAGQANPAATITGLDGHSAVWSFSLDPVINLTGNHDGAGAYVVGGVGFYHKIANFTVPAVGEYCDPYYGCYEYQANQTIDHYTSNAPGVNGGFGLTYKFSRFSNERFYGEVRYVYVFNSQRQGITDFTVTAANANTYNDYPANSNRTSYFPVKFGIRF